MFSKKLLQRIRSMEDYLGIVFVDGVIDYSNYHVTEEHGRMKDLNEIREEREEKK